MKSPRFGVCLCICFVGSSRGGGGGGGGLSGEEERKGVWSSRIIFFFFRLLALQMGLKESETESA